MLSVSKGQCHEIFTSGFFHGSVSPQPQSIPLGPFRIFSNCHWCHWYRWQNMEKISGCRLLKENFKAKIYIYFNSTTQRCPNKIIKIFWLKIFSICHRCKRCQTLIWEYLREFSKKFEAALIVYYTMYNQGLGGNWFMKKTRSKKSRDTVPLKYR